MPAAKPPRLRRFSPDWWAQLLFRSSNKGYIVGIEVGLPGGKKTSSPVTRAKLAEAITLLERYDPRRFAYMQRDVARILVDDRRDYWGCWHQTLAMIELTEHWMLLPKTTPAQIAGVLAHEAMHARLYRWGFGYAEKDRVRIERVCSKAELAFALRLPDTLASDRRAIIRHAEGYMNSDPAIWTNEGRDEATLEAMREMGCPALVFAFVRWKVNRQKRRARAAINKAPN